MEEQVIKFDTAKLAKEKGFDCPTQLYYNSTRGRTPTQTLGERYKNKLPGNIYYISGKRNHNVIYDGQGDDDVYYSAPTQCLLQKWLREVHTIDMMIEPGINRHVEYNYIPVIITLAPNKLSLVSTTIEGYYPTYEEALEIGLQKALKLIKTDGRAVS